MNALLLLAFVAVSPAHAYMDPGSGSMLVQLAAAGTAGIAVLIKLYWARIKTWVSPSKPR